ncbi:hypothetical protein OG512_45165 [Streptomyces sp. NBC_01378]|uniref:hypothetical protein n=1 Tax=Streptomyces sp. NBC_01378 TaxID=2903844 RepID=UPI003247E93B
MSGIPRTWTEGRLCSSGRRLRSGRQSPFPTPVIAPATTGWMRALAQVRGQGVAEFDSGHAGRAVGWSGHRAVPSLWPTGDIVG